VVVVDLVGPMPPSTRGNTRILVLTDHFTRWVNILAILNGSAPTVAWALDQHVLCNFELREQIHTDQGQLMSNLCLI